MRSTKTTPLNTKHNLENQRYDTEACISENEVVAMREILELAWNRLLVVTSVIGDVQGRFIAIMFYYTVLVPFGIGMRLFGDPLQSKTTFGQPHWLERPVVSTTLDDAKRQG
jgi:hypothetical protein